MIKRTKLLGIIVTILLVALLYSNLAVAAVKAEESDLTISVSYVDLQDNDEKLDISQKITVINEGNSVENLSFSFSPNSGYSSLSVSPSTLTITANSNADITLSGKIPVNVDQGTKDIGTLKISSGSQGEVTYAVKTDVKNMLEINRIYVYVNGYEEERIDKTEDKVSDLKPGDEVELRFELKNLFNEDYDEGDIEGTVSIELDDNDFGEDINDEEDFSINAGEKLESSDDLVTFKFTIPENVEEDDYIVDIVLEGNDDNGAEYNTKWKMYLEVNRNKDDVRIESITLTPEEVSCSRESQLSVKVTNFGSNRQKYAALSLINKDLGINEQYNFELNRGADSGSNITKTLTIDLDEDLISAGTYPIVATAFYELDTFSDKKTVNLVVKKCVEGSDVKEITLSKDNISNGNNSKVSATADIVDNQEEAGDKLTSSTIAKTVEKAYTLDDYFMAIMIIAVILMLLIIVLFLIILFR